MQERVRDFERERRRERLREKRKMEREEKREKVYGAAGGRRKRGRLFLPPLLATEFLSRERERGEERETGEEKEGEEFNFPPPPFARVQERGGWAESGRGGKVGKKEEREGRE